MELPELCRNILSYFMRKRVCLFAVLLFAASMTADFAHGAEFWKRHSGNPILSESSDVSRFDSGYVAGPKVVYDDRSGKYFMFYTGCVDVDRPNREAIGLATAPSLTGPWTKYDSSNDRHALFAPGQSGDYDYDRNWGQGTIIKTGSKSWQMWTVGDSDPSPAHVARLGYATSDDGYHWTKYQGNKYGGAIFEDFTTSAGIGTFAVLKEGSKYHAWYSLLYGKSVKYATSENGIDWTVQSTVLSGDIYSVDNVLNVKNTYYMTISRTSLTGVDIYTSTNRADWKILSDASLTPSETGWGSARIYQHFLFPSSDTDWYLFYTGADVADDTQGKIGVARASVPHRAAK